MALMVPMALMALTLLGVIKYKNLYKANTFLNR